MVELVARRALAGRAAIATGGFRIVPRDDLAVRHVVSAVPIAGAIAVGPREWLIVGEAEIALPAAALDGGAASGFAAIDVEGAGALDLIGRAGFVTAAEGALTTRVADLRVTIVHGRDLLRLICERPCADHLWEWIVHRAARFGSTGDGDRGTIAQR